MATTEHWLGVHIKCCEKAPFEGAQLRPRELVVLSYHYPPNGAVGGMRWAGLTKYLRTLGWQTYVIAATRLGASAGPPDDDHVLRCAPYPTLNDVYRKITSRLRASGKTVRFRSGDQGLSRARLSILTWVRREASALLDFPDPERGWILPAVALTRRTLRMLREPVFVSSGPPHSVHIAARLIKTEYRVPWILDFRDPWARVVGVGSPWRPFDQSRLAGLAIPRLERSLVAAADAIIANTPELAAAFKTEYPRTDVFTVRNGVDLTQYGRTSNVMQRPVSVCHVGSLSGNRSPTPVLSAIACLKDRHPEIGPNEVFAIFAGPVAPRQHETLQRAIAGLGLEQHVRVLGVVSREAAHDLVKRAAIAVVLAQGQPLQVPSKLYECAAHGVRTLVVAERSSASHREARRLGADWCAPDDVTRFTALIESVWRGNAQPWTAERVAIDYSARAAELDRILMEVRTRSRL